MAQPRVVSIHYTLTNDQGEELDSSRVEGREESSSSPWSLEIGRAHV